MAVNMDHCVLIRTLAITKQRFLIKEGTSHNSTTTHGYSPLRRPDRLGYLGTEIRCRGIESLVGLSGLRVSSE